MYSDLQIMFKDKQIPTVTKMKFIRLFINNTLSWKTHIKNIKPRKSLTLCTTGYSQNDLLVLLPLSNELWFIVLGELLRQ
jgi:hypothetical protein